MILFHNFESIVEAAPQKLVCDHWNIYNLFKFREGPDTLVILEQIVVIL